MSKHTSGPWFVEATKGWAGDLCIKSSLSNEPFFKAIKPKAYYTDFPQGSKPNSVILSTSLAIKQGRYVATEEIRNEIDLVELANARLIAAAPDLLEALQRIEQRISYYASLAEHEQPNIEQWAYTDQSDDMKIVRAAIRKATGE